MGKSLYNTILDESVIPLWLIDSIVWCLCRRQMHRGMLKAVIW